MGIPTEKLRGMLVEKSLDLNGQVIFGEVSIQENNPRFIRVNAKVLRKDGINYEPKRVTLRTKELKTGAIPNALVSYVLEELTN